MPLIPESDTTGGLEEIRKLAPKFRSAGFNIIRKVTLRIFPGIERAACQDAILNYVSHFEVCGGVK